MDAAKEKLNALREAKAGGNNKRVLDYELKREDDIYDEVRAARWPCALHTPPHTAGVYDTPLCIASRWCTDARSLSPARPRGVVVRVFAPRAQLDEKQYASLVAKRRLETGGFVVGDEDGGCVALCGLNGLVQRP